MTSTSLKSKIKTRKVQETGSWNEKGVPSQIQKRNIIVIGALDTLIRNWQIQMTARLQSSGILRKILRLCI